MVEIAALMMIASGAIHAVVNAVLKSGEDKLASRALIDLSGGLLVLPAIFFVAPPDGAWGWLFGSLLVHAIYFLALVKAFEVADMSAAYPVMRGTAPVFAAMGAVAFLGDGVTVPVALGMGLVTTGIFVSIIGRNLTLPALSYSLLTGLAVACYTVLDAGGVRNAPTPFSYIAWAFFILGAVIGGVFGAWRGRAFVHYAKANWRSCGTAGMAGVVSYGLAMLAFSVGDLPRLAPLRESSILFALAIAILFLGERPERMKIVGGAIIFAGVVILLLAR
ncbi:DMT family transporter [Qipengyuania sp. XHP0207]|uniref:DMT family transporter n=1 Tax=Qipengyuania sp. XHP0207 TaxID=3038078 RepID=UPI00241EF34B|nr:DMT family transporter [Qipengyuania sp. XHP0207]MDG5749425.1 DMT family transporter [Qipengyuania sp. XHP0207]